MDPARLACWQPLSVSQLSHCTGAQFEDPVLVSTQHGLGSNMASVNESHSYGDVFNFQRIWRLHASRPAENINGSGKPKKMTVSYSKLVATAKFSCFLKLLLR